MTYIEHVHEPRRLLLIWQGIEMPAWRRRIVAELVRGDDESVRLSYLVGSRDVEQARVEGFLSFPAFRKLDREYRLGVLETFMRRLPPKTRGDYGDYLEQFRLRRETKISDFALLGYTGAKLPADGFSIVDPLEDIVERCDVLMEVAGFRHTSPIAIDEVPLNVLVQFQPEPENEHDLHAVAIYLGDIKIGYVPKPQAPALRDILQGGLVQASVERKNGRRERPLIYLFVRMELPRVVLSAQG